MVAKEMFTSDVISFYVIDKKNCTKKFIRTTLAESSYMLDRQRVSAIVIDVIILFVIFLSLVSSIVSQ